jgi:cytochrome oxidase Cu insertion factor (SCO1/SenC/PrrC family)
MYPHERSLVQRLQNKPFALLGVNSDEDREQLKEVLKTEQITWRSFWAGGTGGPIPTRWQLTGWPTIILIDKKGVIRNRYDGNPGDATLDREIDKLIQEPESREVS